MLIFPFSQPWHLVIVVLKEFDPQTNRKIKSRSRKELWTFSTSAVNHSVADTHRYTHLVTPEEQTDVWLRSKEIYTQILMITSQEVSVLLYQQTGGYVMRLRLLLGFLFSSLKSYNSVSFSFNVFIVGKAFQLLKSITEETIREKKKKLISQ